MADVSVARLDELEAFHHGTFRRLRAGLGIRAFGVQIVTLPPHCDLYPDHNHADIGQEELYVVTSGRATMRVGEGVIPLEPGTYVRVGPAEQRMVTTGEETVEMLVVGAARGVAYEPQLYTELGGCRAMLTPPSSPVAVGECVRLDASGSTGAEGDELTFEWLPEGSGEAIHAGPVLTHVYRRPGTYRVIVNVTTSGGRWDAASTVLRVTPSK